MRPKLPIAVVIPAFKAADHLRGAIATVRAQTVDVEEIVVVDDGSPDDGAEIAEALGATVLRQANAGCGPARNTGIAHARSPWIALLDADDRWEPEKLELQWAARALDPAVRFISCDTSRWEGEALRCPSNVADYPNYATTPKTRLAQDVVEFSSAALAASLPRGQFLAPATILVERALVMDGVPFSAAPSTPLYHVSEDIEWYLRVLKHTNAIVVEKQLVRYAVGGPSLSSNAGRMHYGMVKLGEMIDADPSAYADGSREGFARARSYRESLTVRAYLRALDTERAFESIANFRARRGSFELDVLSAVGVVAEIPAAREVLQRMRTRWRARRK